VGVLGIVLRKNDEEQRGASRDAERDITHLRYIVRVGEPSRIHLVLKYASDH
jgi:hypothetical protein